MTRQTLANGDIQSHYNFCRKTFTHNPSHSEGRTDSSPLYHMNDFCICGASSDSDANIPSSVKLDKLQKVLCEFVVSGDLPFDIFEKPGFKPLKDIACAVCPGFNTITKRTLLSDALTYHQEERMVVQSELLNAPGRICFAIDIWGNPCTVEEYLCITACWVDYNWRLQKRIIRFLGLASNDGASLANEILLTLGQCKVAEKVCSFIIDEASCSDSLIASLRSHLQRKNALVLSGEICHVRSYSRIINLVGQASIKLMDGVLPKIRNTVMHLKHSIPKQKKFYEAAKKRFGLDTTKRLCLDTFTSWDSTFLMLDCFLYYRDVLVDFVSNDMAIQVYCLTQEEWEMIDELHKFLKEIYELINELSASATPIANFYFFLVWKIHKKLVEISNAPPSILSTMVKEMQAEFEKYWSDFSHTLACAAALDPRFKLAVVERCYAKLYGDVRAKEMIVALKKTLFDLFEEYKQTDAVTSPRVGTSNVSNSGDDSRSSFFEFNENFLAYCREEEEEATQMSELELYWEERREAFKKDFDILEFWKKTSGYYGPYEILSSMARDILTIPISIAPLESGYDMEKKLIPLVRSHLSPETIEALTCYRDWLRAKGISSGSSKFSSYDLEKENEDGDEF